MGINIVIPFKAFLLCLWWTLRKIYILEHKYTDSLLKIEDRTDRLPEYPQSAFSAIYVMLIIKIGGTQKCKWNCTTLISRRHISFYIRPYQSCYTKVVGINSSRYQPSRQFYFACGGQCKQYIYIRTQIYG